MAYTLPKTMHVNSDYTKVVEETDPEVAFVLGPKGHVISDELARQLGLLPAVVEPAPESSEPLDHGGFRFPAEKNDSGDESPTDDTPPEDPADPPSADLATGQTEPETEPAGETPADPEGQPTDPPADSTTADPVTIDATEAALALAAEHDLDLSLVTGSGEDGRILKGDVATYLEALS